MMTITIIGNLLSAAFTLGAAILWLLSARVKLPEDFSGRAVQPDEYAENKIAGPDPEHAAGTIKSEGLRRLGRALARQSALSASAAACAFIAAAAQTVVALAPVVAPFIAQ